MRLWAVLRLVLPSVWMGLIVGLSFLEAPLKFQAPGITIPLGLGIGRLVFIALAVAGWTLLLAITLVGVPAPRRRRSGWIVLAALWITLGVQSFVIRPALSARSDIIIAGGDPGGSWLHYGYITAEVVLLALLILLVIVDSRPLTSQDDHESR